MAFWEGLAAIGLFWSRKTRWQATGRLRTASMLVTAKDLALLPGNQYKGRVRSQKRCLPMKLHLHIWRRRKRRQRIVLFLVSSDLGKPLSSMGACDETP